MQHTTILKGTTMTNLLTTIAASDLALGMIVGEPSDAARMTVVSVEPVEYPYGGVKVELANGHGYRLSADALIEVSIADVRKRASVEDTAALKELDSDAQTALYCVLAGTGDDTDLATARELATADADAYAGHVRATIAELAWSEYERIHDL